MLMWTVSLTSLAVIPSVTRGRAKMQKMVTPSLTGSTEQMATVGWLQSRCAAGSQS